MDAVKESGTHPIGDLALTGYSATSSIVKDSNDVMATAIQGDGTHTIDTHAV